MAEGEYAVHFSDLEGSPHRTAPFCLLFNSLPAAVEYSTAEVARHPGLRCRIYDHNGFTGAPLREIKGSQFRDNTDISAHFRRWVGSFLFFGGALLAGADWTVDFRWLWPSMLGTRMLMPGSILLMTELIIRINAWHRRRQVSQGSAA